METTDQPLYVMYLVVLIVFVLFKAVYSMFEVAILRIDDSNLKHTIEDNPKYASLMALLQDTKKLKLSFLVAKTFNAVCIVFTVMQSGIFTDSVYTPLQTLLVDTMHLKIVSNVFTNMLIACLSFIVFVMVLVLAMVVFTDTIPKRVAQKNTLKVALSGVSFVKLMMTFFNPLTSVIGGLSYGLCKLFGLEDSTNGEKVTEEKILMMVEEGNENGSIDQNEKEMINNIFEFNDVIVSEVMTHRKDINAIDTKSNISDLVRIAVNEGYSRIPVYQDNIDNIIGIIYVKDLLILIGYQEVKTMNINHFIHKAMYVPESSKCSEVFESMSVKKVQMAIVVDEYGGTAGLVTMEDILEQIVGNIQDEYDDDGKEFEEVSNGIFIIDGSTDPEDLSEVLGITLPEDHNYDTMSAFIVDLIGHIPTEDETSTVEYQNITFTTLLVEDNWISKIKAIVKVKSETE